MGLDDAAPVAKSLTKKLNESKPFEVVAKNDSIKVVVLIPSMPRMGGGLIFAKSADDLAKTCVDRLPKTSWNDSTTQIQNL